jgi:uncharacterized protein (DUF2147 family)
MSINRKVAAAFWLSTIELSILGPRVVAPALAAEPLGTWYTEGRESQVRISNCGDALCGALVWLKEPNDPKTGKAKTDNENFDASKRNRPLLGVQIVFGLKPSGTPNHGRVKFTMPRTAIPIRAFSP